MSYAVNTKVSVEKSKAEIEKILGRYGADQFMMGTKPGIAMIGFRAHEKIVQFHLPLPSRNDEKFTIDKRRFERPAHVSERLWEQACRSKWRSLALCIKAKLEAVDAGITTFEAEFMAHLVIPGKGRLGDLILPQLDKAYEGKPANLLEWAGK